MKRMRKGEVGIADRFPEATILFSDLVDFTNLASRYSPGQIIEILNNLFSSFDALAKQLKLEKIKTIGDAYMVAGGLPEEQPDHALAVADMALGMIEAVRRDRRAVRRKPRGPHRHSFGRGGGRHHRSASIHL